MTDPRTRTGQVEQLVVSESDKKRIKTTLMEASKGYRSQLKGHPMTKAGTI